MKKIVLLTAVVSFFISGISAQETLIDYRNNFQFGLKIGTNLSNVYDSQGEQFNADPKFVFVTGAFFAIPIGTFLGFQPEILFSQKGFKATGMILGSPYEFTRTTNFLDIPLLFSLKPGPRVSLVIGPQYSYLMKQNDRYTGAPVNLAQEQEFKNENIRKNLLCFLGGADINIDKVILGLRAGWDIQNNNGDGTSSTPRYKNVWYQATVGFRF